ncbi:FtsK/SpoIIIE domain-containing protein [Leifsonia sp. TF02-11]|uniref:FtsK/SpoIIIE domain-containing protein n=1 Tax=Leifsonia sp. TF02-11 TaxID=2815212 RepID=UPI001AA0EA24|nr:FtsK/SpoIIIE domain-containing protein [Leifsonia sp. TF02-11]MBO1741680.1 FHA domain-containing protein [Leifsonia sp. TF02-11]
MKYTITHAGTSGPEDLLVTADVSVTVADLAARLAGRRESGADRAGGVTIRVEPPGTARAIVLDPASPLYASSLRSGHRVEVVPPGVRRAGDERDDEPAALVRLVSGPDAGREFRIPTGVSLIGRDPSAAVRLDGDREVSRRHATVTVAETVAVADLNSANGVVVDGCLVRSAELDAETRVRIGGTELCVLPLAGSLRRPPSQTGDGFIRPPRVEPAPVAAKVVLPEPPVPDEPPRLPVIALAAPALLGVALFAVTGQALSLVFAVLSPVMLVGSWVDGRVRGRTRRSARRRAFDAALRGARTELVEARAREVRARILEAPSTSAVAEAMHLRSPLLWSRRPGTDAFLRLRLGAADLPSRVEVTLPVRDAGESGDVEAVKALAREFRDVPGVPVVERLDHVQAIGVAGTGPLADGVARALVVQAAGLHSPAELAIAAIVGDRAMPTWSWLKWLPHVDSRQSPLRGTPALACDPTSTATLLGALESIAAARKRHGIPRPDEPGFAVSVLVVVAGVASADRSRLVALAESRVGMALIWTADEVDSLPAVCGTFVHLGAAASAPSVGFARESRTVHPSALETIDPIAAETAARALAPVADSGAPVGDQTDLPRSVAMFDLFGDIVASDPEAIVRRWTRTDSLTAAWVPGRPRDPGALRAVVGRSQNGPMALDLRADGPHALVGGTTGSGKSEFLQTWIMALAAEYAPDRLTFLLVDYKGGAAFAECADLPHTVGLVTDLTRPLVRRALVSLRAELARRERVLSRAGAKDMTAMEAAGDPAAPPALVIVVDEFAALAADLPEFLAGVLDIAQRGRSLGLHLVLATQRPSGVVKDDLRANTNLRIALRVADAADSVDVVGVPDAAGFAVETPGRALVARGQGRRDIFQTGYLGGDTSSVRRRPELTVQSLPFGAGERWPEEPGEQESAGARPDRGARNERDIARLARTMSAAADRAGIAVPRRPWVEPLPTSVGLEELPSFPDGVIALGLRDEPRQQRQRPVTVDLDTVGHLAVLGGGGSGLSTTLRTVAAALTASCVSASATGLDPLARVELYAIDCAGGGLALLDGLPTVGSVVPGGDTERIDRLLGDLLGLIERRSTLLGDARASTVGQYRAATGNALARVVLVLDGLEGFRAENEFRDAGRPLDRLIALASTGRQVGVHLVVSCSRSGMIPTALAAKLGATITLGSVGRESPFADRSASYDGIDEDIDAAPGRGVFEGDAVQVAVPGGSQEAGAQAAALDELARRVQQAGLLPTAPIRRLEPWIPRGDLPAVIDGRPTIGVGYETLEPVGLPPRGLFVVSGPFGSGRTTAIRTIVEAAFDAHPDTEAHLVSLRTSALVDAAPWGAAADTPDATSALVADLTARIPNACEDELRRLLIVVEGVGDFEGDPVEAQTARLVKVARRAGVAVVAECDPVTAPTAWQIFAELKAARAGLVLQPDEGDGLALFRTPFPRVPRGEFPAGRGYLIEGGRLTRLQIAVTKP